MAYVYPCLHFMALSKYFVGTGIDALDLGEKAVGPPPPFTISYSLCRARVLIFPGFVLSISPEDHLGTHSIRCKTG